MPSDRLPTLDLFKDSETLEKRRVNCVNLGGHSSRRIAMSKNILARFRLADRPHQYGRRTRIRQKNDQSGAKHYVRTPFRSKLTVLVRIRIPFISKVSCESHCFRTRTTDLWEISISDELEDSWGLLSLELGLILYVLGNPGWTFFISPPPPHRKLVMFEKCSKSSEFNGF